MSYRPEHFACWFEIPVTDLEAARAFYGAVFQMELAVNHNAPIPTIDFPTADPKTGISGHLYEGKPSQDGPTIHLVVPDTLAAAKARLEKAGGRLVGTDVEIPAGTFCYARDPDGNSIGLFQSRT